MASLLEHFVAGHRDAFDGWRELVDALVPDDWDRPTGCPGWSVRDNLAHVVALEREMLGDPYPVDHVLPGGLDHVRTEFDEHVERSIDVRRGVPIDELVDEFDQTVKRRLAALDAIDEAAFTAPGIGIAGATTTPKRFLGIRVFDIHAHQQDARRATGHPGRLTGPAAEITHDRIRRGVLHHLPQRFDGDGVLVIEVTGDLPATWAVDLGTGEQFDQAQQDVRTTLTVAWADLIPLACGRSDARADAVAISGDEAAGRQAVASLAMTP